MLKRILLHTRSHITKQFLKLNSSEYGRILFLHRVLGPVHMGKSYLGCRAVARTLIGGGGGCIFIYSGSARLVSFEIKLISKEISRAEPEYMNAPPQLAF